MRKYLFFLFLVLPLVSGNFAYDNPYLPKLIPVERETTIISGGGGNVSGLDSAVANATYIKQGYGYTSGGVNYSTLGFCGIDSTFGVFGCNSYIGYDLWFSTGDKLNRMVFADAGYVAFVSKDFIEFYTGETSFGSAVRRFKINNTAVYLERDMRINGYDIISPNNITGWIDSDCPTGNYSYGLYVNGSFKCRSDTSGGSSSGSSTQQLVFNTSSIMEAGYTGTAGSFATLTYLAIGSGTTSVNTAYNNRLKNITYDGWVGNMKVVRNSAGANMNVTLFVNGLSTNLTCNVPAGTFVGCQNLTHWIKVTDKQTWAVGVRSANATTLTNIGVSFEFRQQQNLTINVTGSGGSSPVSFIRNSSCPSLDTVYQNVQSSGITVEGSIITNTKCSSDQAEVKIYVGANPPTNQIMSVGIRNNEINAGVTDDRFHPFSFSVAPYENYTLTSVLAGSSAITLDYCNEVTK